MNQFTKYEYKILVIIFTILFVITGFNISLSLRRGRDSIRKNDISAVTTALDTYYQKYRIYPISTNDNLIIGCFEAEVVRDIKTGYPTNAITCKWGESYFESVNLMPRDPSYKKGVNYSYISDGKKFEFYISLEGKDESEYTPAIASKNLQCGTKICNYGRSN